MPGRGTAAVIAALACAAGAGAALEIPADEPAPPPARAAAPHGAPPPAFPAARTLTVGRSSQGRSIRAVRVGSPRARRRILVVGEIHGNELAGIAVTRRLRHVRPPRGVELWLVDMLNPDGAAAGTRQNARGVDLNRNFPYRWRAMGRPFDTYYPGTGPMSEPESRAAATLVERVRPEVSVWYHQHLTLVTDAAGDPALERLYSRLVGLPRRRLPPYPGTAISWQNRRFRGSTAFVVELPPGRLPRRSVRRHASAVLAEARAILPPRVRRRPIPFGQKRKEEMRAYARRHYGIDDYRLRNPKVIVEHYTATDDFPSTYNTFAPDTPDPELHELPGVCSHFVVDHDGAVYQLVSTRIMCRHTVGLNWTAIGIEHVGRSDAQVLGNRRQRRASLRLTRWLQGRYRIATRNVIGHNESLSSPYHRERVARLRNQTHGDFRRASMRRYRSALRRLPAPTSLVP
jgi:N-acetylmuramoyl-L-alanine amidase